jgi:hypothetical protein
MYLSKRVKVVAGVSALLGVVMAGGAAFTATGVTDEATASQFVGGSFSQTVTGGTELSSIVYSYADNTPPSGPGDTEYTEIDSVLLTFADVPAGVTTPTIQFTTTDDTPADADTAWTCSAIGTPSANESACIPSGDLATDADPTPGPGYVNDVTGVTVSLAPVA